MIQLQPQPCTINSHIHPHGFLFNQRHVLEREREGVREKLKREILKDEGDTAEASGFNNEPVAYA